MSDLLYSIVGIAVGAGALYYLYTKDLQPSTSSSDDKKDPKKPSDPSTPDPVPSPPPVPPAAPTGPSWVDFVSPVAIIKDAIEGNLTPDKNAGTFLPLVMSPDSPHNPPSVLFKNSKGDQKYVMSLQTVDKGWWTDTPGTYTFIMMGDMMGDTQATLSAGQKTTGLINTLSRYYVN